MSNIIYKIVPSQESVKNTELEGYINQFENEIYKPAFPDENEREDIKDILSRLKRTKDEPQSFIVLALEGNTVMGGLVADWYNKCKSLEIIYIALRREYCGHKEKYGKKLYYSSLAIIKDAINKQNEQVKYVYAEVEDPFKDIKSNGFTDPIIRLRFFASLGAKRIPIEYVQPPLKESGEYARNLFLISIPISKSDKEEMKILPRDLGDFLSDFYEGLRENSMNDLATFEYEKSKIMNEIKMATDYNGNIILDNILEESIFTISNTSVAAHYTVKSISEENALVKHNKDFCRFFYSYESDLLNYRNQISEERPLYSHHLKTVRNVCLQMPSCYKYTSEGLEYFRICKRREVKVDISLNIAYNTLSGKYLLSVVIKPYEDEKDKDHFTELDIIRLVTGFGSRQEKCRYLNYDCKNRSSSSSDLWMEGLKIRSDSDFFVPMAQWLSAELGGGISFICQGTGVSELDLGSITCTCTNNDTDKKREKLFAEFSSFKDGILSKDKKATETKWNKVLCGIILGIFDYKRMNAAEIHDTFRSAVTFDSSYGILCRGHLTKIYFSTDKGDDQDEDILISPYFLVPSTVLAFNEELLKGLLNRINDDIKNEEIFANDNSHKKDKTFYKRSKNLQKEYKEISADLDKKYLRDIFQYDSEQKIYKCGSSWRGHDSMLSDINTKLHSIADTRDYYMKEYNSGFDMDQNMLLLCLAFMQIITAVLTNCNVFIMIGSFFVVLVACWCIGRYRINKNRKP